jgi:hydrogenase maturation protease
MTLSEIRSNRARCLILACGNTLRGDDGVGPWLASWAEERFDGEAGVRVVSRQQWTLELAEEIAAAEAVLFVDCTVAFGAGLVCVADVQASAHSEKIDTHQQGASELLGMARDLYASLPRAAMLLTVGAGSLELGEEFSAAVKAALPEACRLLDETVVRLLAYDRWSLRSL